MDAELHKLTAAFGNVSGNNIFSQAFSATTGLLTGACYEGPSTAGGTSPGTYYYCSGYTYDHNGNVLTRGDSGTNETETYDALDRLSTSAVTNGPSKSFAYDFGGNVTNKSDVGNYTYPVPAPARCSPTLSPRFRAR